MNSLGRWHERAVALEMNRERWKHAFRTSVRWSQGVGAARTKLSKCVEIGVMTWYPDRAYIGFQEVDDRRVRIQAVDMFGEFIDAVLVWWDSD